MPRDHMEMYLFGVRVFFGISNKYCRHRLAWHFAAVLLRAKFAHNRSLPCFCLELQGIHVHKKDAYVNILTSITMAPLTLLTAVRCQRVMSTSLYDINITGHVHPL